MEHDANRRSFMGFAAFGLGAIFSAIIGVPVTLYVVDPRHRKPPRSELKRVEGVKLDEIGLNMPSQGVILDTRRDGWTLYPSDVVGRVWVVRVGARPNLAAMNADELDAFNQSAAQKDAYLKVFTTICPHLGCSVNLDANGTSFLCPCHSARFAADGSRVAPASNPSARDMDTLEWQIDPTDPERNRIVVKYESYKATKPLKELV